MSMMIPPDQADPTANALIGAATRKPSRADFESVLGDAEAAVQTAIDAAQDPAEKATLSKCLVAIHGMQASHQKLADQATGTGPGAQFVRKMQGTY